MTYSFEEIVARLELGRLQVMATETGSRLIVAHAEAPPQERRQVEAHVWSTGERRTFKPLNLPTLFPENGPILILVVGGFATDATLRQPLPFWEDDAAGGHLVWQALARAGLLHRKDADFTLGRGGVWDAAPPRTTAVAMTYVGFQAERGGVAFDLVVHPWNSHRLETLVEACWSRSGDRLRVVTLGEAARFMLCAIAYGRPGLSVLSLPEPTQVQLSRDLGHDSAAGLWLEWASDLLSIGSSGGT